MKIAALPADVWRAGLGVVLCLMAGAASAQNPGFKVSVLPDVDPRGFRTVLVENTSTQPITAIRLTQKCDHGDRNRGQSMQNFETAFNNSVRPIPNQKPVAPGEQRKFYIRADAATCPSDAAVLFADGHGEGLADGPWGWKNIIAARQQTLDEFSQVRAFVESVTAGDFKQAFKDELIARLAKYARPPIPFEGPTEAQQRRNMTNWMLTVLNMPDGPFASKPEALRTLDRWMEPIRASLLTTPTPARPSAYPSSP
jgi:hypothetical protein